MNVIFLLSQEEPDLLKELMAFLEIAGEEGEISFKNYSLKMRRKIAGHLSSGCNPTSESA